MTLCIAALCEDSRILVLAADNLVSMGWVSAELAIQKAQQIHQNWWVMIAGEPANALDIIDWTKQQLSEGRDYTVDEVNNTILANYHRKRLAMVESTILMPLGWTMGDFKTHGQSGLGLAIFTSVQNDLRTYNLGVDLVVCGFAPDGVGHISSIGHPGQFRRHDLYGFHAIGVGMFGALYIMYYREVSVKMSVQQCVYYVYEGHYFGYQSGGVGDVTDILVLQHGTPPLYLDDRSKNTLDKIWSEVVMKEPKRLSRIVWHLSRLRQSLTVSDTQPSTPDTGPD